MAFSALRLQRRLSGLLLRDVVVSFSPKWTGSFSKRMQCCNTWRTYSQRQPRARPPSKAPRDPNHNREFFEQSHESKPGSRSWHEGRKKQGQEPPEPGGPQQFSWRDLILPGSLLLFFSLLPDGDTPGNGVFRDITWQVS